jgi:hypothetical protein
MDQKYSEWYRDFMRSEELININLREFERFGLNDYERRADDLDEIDLEELKDMLTSDNINIQYKRGKHGDYIDCETPFHWLCMNNEITIESLQFGIDLGGDFTIESDWDINGPTPACFLCKNKSITVPILQFLIDNNVNITTSMKYNLPSLYMLCYNKSIRLELLQFAIEYINDYFTAGYYNNNYTSSLRENIIIHITQHARSTRVLCGNESITIKLLKFAVIHGADFNSGITYYDDTPFHYLCENKATTAGLIQFAIQHGAITCKYTHKNSFDFNKIIKKKNVMMLILLQLLRYTICGPIILEEIIELPLVKSGKIW